MSSRSISVVLLRVEETDYFKRSPKPPETVLTRVVDSENDPTLMDLLKQLRGMENCVNCDTESALAFFFQKDSICPAVDGRVLKLSTADMHQHVSELGLVYQFDKIVFVRQKLQQDVNAKMESHFKIHNTPDGWLRRDKVTEESLLNIFNNNCELMVESIMNSVVTQYSKIASSRFTFEDLFFIKLYTFAQWVHCVRFCGQNIEDLGNLIQTPCVKCGLRSDQDSWYSRFNADTRCSGAKAKFWSVETCKLIDSLKKAERKETKFFRGFNIPMDELFFLVVDAVKPGETLKTHSGGYRAEVVTPSGTKTFKHVHSCKHSDDHTVAFVVDGDPPDLTNHQHIFTCDENGNRKLVGQMNDGIFEPGEAIANDVNVVNSRTSPFNRLARLTPGDLVLNGCTSVMSVSDNVCKAEMYAGKKKGTLWEIETGYSGGKDINDFSIIPEKQSDNETLIQPGTEMRVLEVCRCDHKTYEDCKKEGKCRYIFKDLVRVRMLVNLNSSTQVELSQLPHVGSVRSRIIHDSGGFENSDEFCRRVQGFGGFVYWNDIAQYVTFGPETKRLQLTASMEYDRDMAIRRSRQRISELEEGPNHPWGASWTRLPGPNHIWNSNRRKWNGNIHGTWTGSGKPNMTKPENYQPGYREPAEPKMPKDYKPTGCFDDKTGERICWGEDWNGENDDSESSQQDAQDEEKADLDCLLSTASTDSPPPSSSAGSETSNSLQKTKPKEASSIKLEIGSPSACREPEVLFRDGICAGGGAS